MFSLLNPSKMPSSTPQVSGAKSLSRIPFLTRLKRLTIRTIRYKGTMKWVGYDTSGASHPAAYRGRRGRIRCAVPSAANPSSRGT